MEERYNNWVISSCLRPNKIILYKLRAYLDEVLFR